MHRAETALNVGERAAQKNDNLFFGERFEHIDAAARQQRAVDFERRIFGRGSDQPNAAFSTCGRKASCCALLKR